MLAWINLAYLEKDMGNSQVCTQICEKVLQMDPNNEKAYELQGDLYKLFGHMDKAFIFYSKAIEMNPESSSSICNIAQMYQQQGKLKEAIEHYKKALSVKLDLASAFQALVHVKY